jgi:hypothetical protein
VTAPSPAALQKLAQLGWQVYRSVHHQRFGYWFEAQGHLVTLKLAMMEIVWQVLCTVFQFGHEFQMASSELFDLWA